MLTLRGKYNEATIFCDEVESSATSQIIEMLSSKPFEKGKIRIMPDVHAGKGSVIGFTMELNKEYIIPNIVGVDIGCGMYLVNLGNVNIDYVRLDEFIRKNIPMGMKRNTEVPKIKNPIVLKIQDICEKIGLDTHSQLSSLGSLGGGNHFIEINQSESGEKYLVIHSGSRNFGLQVAKYHQNIAENLMVNNEKTHKDYLNKLVGKARQEGKEKTIEKIYEENKKDKIPKSLAFLYGKYAEDYLEDMYTAQIFARWNREIMAKKICEFFNINYEKADKFHTIHNYIDFSSNIIRKGAISAKFGEKVVIPLNMKDGIILARGKGNTDWNESAPHGAGRLMGRGEAKEKLNTEEFKAKMALSGVWSSSVGKDTLDESPDAYKPAEMIINAIKETVDILEIIKPVYNIKAGGED